MKVDQRIALTKRLLREGLLRLLDKTELNKISVTQLCTESGINRATFYRHYEEPRDILNDIKCEIFQEVAILAEKAALKGDTIKWLEATCCYFYEHSAIWSAETAVALYRVRHPASHLCIVFCVRTVHRPLHETECPAAGRCGPPQQRRHPWHSDENLLQRYARLLCLL